MSLTTGQLLVSLITALGLNAIVSTGITVFWQRRNAKQTRHEEYKEARYKCIILLMHGYLFFESAQADLKKYGYENVRSERDLWQLIWGEYINSYLYASDEFIGSLIEFIQKPTATNLHRTALAIRKDLWGRKTKIKVHQIPPGVQAAEAVAVEPELAREQRPSRR